MDEIARCCAILEVEPGASLEQVKRSYRDAVKVWHPDRFGHDERLRLKAETRLKEITLAYKYLLENAFHQGGIPEIATEPSSPPSVSAGPRFWLTSVVILMAAAALLILGLRHRGPPKTHDNAPASSAGPNHAAPSALVALPPGLASGLVLYYNFDTPPSSEIFPDLSGHGNDGHAVGVQWIPAGHRGGAVQFGLTNSYIRVPNSETLNPKELTLAVWIKTSFTDPIFRRIFDKGWNQGYDLTMGGVDDKGYSAQGQAFLEVARQYISSHIKVADGTWRHLVGTFDGSELRFYVDGKLTGEPARAKGDPAPTTYDLTLGANRSNPNAAIGEVGSSFNGMMDDAMMFNFCLSAEEVQALFDSQKVP